MQLSGRQHELATLSEACSESISEGFLTPKRVVRVYVTVDDKESFYFDVKARFLGL